MRPIALESRKLAITKLQQESFDIIVVGGGITGVGIAQDAASRGLKVALLEKGDYAIGTSSRSSKLIHGGLRYLAQGDFKVTYESCSERALLQELAPHLVKPLSFLIPIYRWRHGLQIFAGLWVYDVISLVRNSEFHKRVDIPAMREIAPLLETNGLHLGYLYHDCQTNDARLVIEVAKSAASLGATLANYLKVDQFIKEQGKIVGVKAYDELGQQTIEVRAKLVVNATGIWLDDLCQADRADLPHKIRPAKGVHITIARDRIPTKHAMLFESAAKDGRSVFFIPWYEGIIIGTTDTDYQGNIESPKANDADIDYILAAVNSVFPAAKVTRADILSSYAGLRPLVDEGKSSTKDVSREHRIFESEAGLISIAGGKLTTYRLMAVQLMDHVAKCMQARGLTTHVSSSTTDKIYLSGLTSKESLTSLTTEVTQQAQVLGITAEVAQHLVADYGVNAHKVLALVAQTPALATIIHPNLPFIQAEVVYGVEAEQVNHLADFLVRRSRIALLTADQGISVAPTVAQLIGQAAHWDSSRQTSELADYKQLVSQYSAVSA